MKKIGWKILSAFGLVIVFFGVFGNVAVLQRYDLGPEVLNAGYTVMVIGLSIFALGLYKWYRINAERKRLPPIDGIKLDEELLDIWKYSVKVGFLRYATRSVVLTNKRILCGDEKTRKMLKEWDLSEVTVVANNRQNVSNNAYNFSHITFNNAGGDNISLGKSYGASSGITQTIGDLEFIKNGQSVFWITNIADPDGVVERIRAIQNSYSQGIK